MTDVADQLETGRPEPHRDQYDRAMLLNPSGARVPYTRVSTIAKSLDDQSTLINYNMRLCAVGLTRRKDLYDLVGSLRDPDGNDKGELREIVKEAAVVGGQGVKANMGTTRHKVIERIDGGESPTSILMPDDVKRDVEAYLTELDRVGLRPLPQYNEIHVVREGFDYNGLGYSGSGDKVLGDGSELFIADIKTGQEVKYANLAWAVQQACYANADAVYDVRTDTRFPMPKVSREVAFIIWLPAGQGRCEILEVDIANGWRWAQVAVEVRRARAHGRVDLRRDGCLLRKYEPVRQQTLLTLVPTDGPSEPVVVPPKDTEIIRRTWLADRLKNASDAYRGLVAQWWGEWNVRSENGGIAGLSTDHQHTTWELDRIQQWCDEAEAQTQETLTADPTVVASKALLKQFPGTIDEGQEVDQGVLVTLSANLGLWCQPQWLGLLNAWRDEAIRLGHDFGVKECPTTRRVALYELGANLCNICEGNVDNIDLAWAVLTTALGWPSVPDTPFGMAFSMLSISDIEKCMEVVVQTPMLALYYDPNTGCPTWGPVTADNKG